MRHARDDLGAPLSWDLGFLASGGLLVVGGWRLHRRGVRSVEEAAREASQALDRALPGGQAVRSTTAGNRREVAVKAHVGDKIVVRSTHQGEAERSGEVIGCHEPDGGPPYRVRWEDGHEGLFFPQGTVSVLPVESTHG